MMYEKTLFSKEKIMKNEKLKNTTSIFAVKKNTKRKNFRN